MVRDTWDARDYPVLVAAAELLEERGGLVASTDIAEATGIERSEVVKALGLLGTRYLRIKDDHSLEGRDYVVLNIYPDGLEAVDQWPTRDTAADRMLAAVEALIEQSAEGSERKSRLVKVRDGLLGAGRDVIVEVAGAALSGRLGV